MAITLVVDGTDSQLVAKMGMNRIVANAFASYDCLIVLIYNEKDHSIVNQTAMTLIKLSDREMQRLLHDLDNNDSIIAMKGLPGKARARIFDNVSTNLRILFTKDMEYMGPVRMKDVEEACVVILKTVIKLEEQAEIAGFASQDLAILKVVIDMYETGQKEDNELKEKYKELHEMIDRIYNS